MKKLVLWYYGTASIRKKLVLSYLVLVIVPITVLGAYSYNISKKNLLEQTYDTMKGNVSSIEYSLNNSIQRENDNIKYLSYNSNFRERLKKAPKNRNALAKELNDSIEPTFWYFITSDKNIKAIEIYSPYVKQAIGSFLKPEDGYQDQPWYVYGQTVFKTLWTYEEGRLFATRTLLDADTSSEPIGIMKLEVFPDHFISSIYQSRFLNNGVVLMNQDKKIIAKREIGALDLENEIHMQMIDMDAGDYIETDQFMMTSSKELVNGWVLYYYIDKHEISDQLNQIMVTTVFIMGLCMMLVAIFISIISRILSGRILQLKGYAEQVSKGDFNVTLNKEYSDEIGVVAQSFHTMTQKITNMMDEMYELGLEKRAVELKALQAMINPHFLYNCLSSIKWKALRADQEEIGDITGLLAKFYRTTLNGGKQITQVKNEIENVKSYLELQTRTHEDRFHVEYDISIDGQELMMPNFLLQPIVENAICHGVDYCEENIGGLIRFEYKKDGEYLLFHIYNTGPHLTQSEVEKILAAPGNGYGLYNIQERIRMYYDDSCGVSSSISEDGLICFTVRLKDQIESITRLNNKE